MEIIPIPLPKLVPSPVNVRKTGSGDIAELAASIQAHGLLQNLTVVDHGDQYRVVAGGMRLRALQDLAKLSEEALPLFPDGWLPKPLRAPKAKRTA